MLVQEDIGNFKKYIPCHLLKCNCESEASLCKLINRDRPGFFNKYIEDIVINILSEDL